MTGKEMKKLRRDELLEMLIEQTKRKDELEQKLAQAEEKLKSREIALQEAGTLAEAALQLNAIFEAADTAASQYLDNVRAMTGKQQANADRIESDAQERAERQLAMVAEKCKAMEEETRQRCEAMKVQAKKEADSYWAEVSRRIEQYLKDHEELTEWLLLRRESKKREEQA